MLGCSRSGQFIVKDENTTAVTLSTLTGIDFSEGVPAGTHLLEVVALGYFFPPVSQVCRALLFEFAIKYLLMYVQRSVEHCMLSPSSRSAC